MIDPAGIEEKARRLYPKFVTAWLAGDTFFPRRIPVDMKLPADLGKAKTAVNQLSENCKSQRSFGYRIVWQHQRRRIHGENNFPKEIWVDTAEDYLRLAGLDSEFDILVDAVNCLRKRQPKLEPWLRESTHWKQLFSVASDLKDLLSVVEWLVENPRPGCFAREIPLPVSTKLIEQNQRMIGAWLDQLLPPGQIDFNHSYQAFEPRYGLHYVRHHLLLRSLDEELQQRLGLPFAELSLPVQSIARLPAEAPNGSLPRVIVVENKVNLLTLPEMRQTLAIGGLGNAIMLTRQIDWLAECPILYWGDLDVEGFQILGKFRGLFPQTQSWLMDRETFDAHRGYAIPWPNHSAEPPVNLNAEELSMRDYLLTHRLRLEQERIMQSYVTTSLCTVHDQRSAPPTGRS